MSSNTLEKVQTKDLKEYKAFFKEIKEKILTSQVKAALAVNHELINLYWEIGSKIHLKQKDEGWGAKTIENLAKDLKSTFPLKQVLVDILLSLKEEKDVNLRQRSITFSGVHPNAEMKLNNLVRFSSYFYHKKKSHFLEYSNVFELH